MKKLVKQKYGKIAKNTESCCCISNNCCDSNFITFSDSYLNINGYLKEADLGLGCGLPTEFANIKNGDTVVDLGCGTGNDCFIARSKVGKNGTVYGIDFTPQMIERAKMNNQKLGYKNVTFLLSDIEEIPLPDKSTDVVISNCVLNLVRDKRKVFSEIFRILKENGHFCISDIVTTGKLPKKLQKDAELYIGCIAGAIQFERYIKIIKESGFKNISVKQAKKIPIPNSLLKKYLNNEGIKKFNDESKILSITIYAEK
ncbi:MAG: tRNA (adenine57/58-N1)-methyltransferase [Ignavibacteriae bacterium]|nr:MAG: tRNA (adenine57/58-N1)-methyltransferase [Ignavibacteriota bacterium]